eukprot:TRINITY_DN559_c0_g3_i1.p1 TRINITY_DN559_c0_g3~~TRINITY_DN559_c0_g3_i1.p1  ORF type:complete len:267 (+),score=66.12 TRINITY_DN559_c0_g3_i1:78-803(+)
MSITLREIVLVSPNPAPFQDEFQWRVRLDVLEEVPGDVEFKVLWLSSDASGAQSTQVLEDCEVGPLCMGTNELILPHDAPDWRAIPPQLLLSVGYLLISVRYQDREFLRIAHFVNVALASVPAAHCLSAPQPGALRRNVLTGKPQISSRVIDWGLPCPGDSVSGLFYGLGAGSRTEPLEGSRSVFSAGRSRDVEFSNASCTSGYGRMEGVEGGDDARGPMVLPCPVASAAPRALAAPVQLP